MPESATATVPLTAPGAGAPPAPGAGAPPPVFNIPEAYKEKPYLKGIDSPDKLFSLLDGAQELIGKRPAGIPAPDAPPEEWQKFYDAVGRPKTPAEYQFDIPKEVKVDDKIVNQIKQMMHEEGLTPTQAKNLQKKFDALTLNIVKEKKLALQQQDTDFDKLATTTFGADRDKVMAVGKHLIDTFAPPAIKAEVAKLSNEALIVLSGVLKGINDKYIKADGAPTGGGPGGGQGSSGAPTPDTLRAEARALMVSEAYTNSMHFDHEIVKSQVDELYRRAAGVQQK